MPLAKTTSFPSFSFQELAVLYVLYFFGTPMFVKDDFHSYRIEERKQSVSIHSLTFWSHYRVI
jgi:hypothetical protein